MRLQIEYADQNESFATLLPREGFVESTPRSSDSILGWHLLRLDSLLFYEGNAFSHFLVASRWQEQTISATAPVSVFILLVPSGAGSVADGFSHKQFTHVAWDMAHVIAAQQGTQTDAPRATY